MPVDRRPVLEIARAFTKLGLTSFGGPVAHMGYFHSEFIEKRHWLDDDTYADLIALCQFLPGPASSQVVFAIGMLTGGLVGGVVASICFTLPSALLMIGFAYGLSRAGDIAHAGWLGGLKLAAVAVVAQAVVGMATKLWPDRARAMIGIVSAAVLILAPGALAQLAVIIAGASTGYFLYRHEVTPIASDDPPPSQSARRIAIGAWILLFSLLALLPLLAHIFPLRPVRLFDSFYRAGALVFGGGHVVLPLLRAEVVPNDWVSNDQFLAGYGAVQAVPGPLFTFAAFLGTAMVRGPFAWANGLWCVAAIFLPSWLLVTGALPFWHRLRGVAGIQAALRGANASVVGLLIAALYRPVITDSVHDARNVVAVLLAFACLYFWKVSPWIVVAMMAVLGRWVAG